MRSIIAVLLIAVILGCALFSSSSQAQTTTTTGLKITYTWDGLLTSNIQIIINADLATNGYVAVASSTSGMNAGSGVACKLQTSALPSSYDCRGISTSGSPNGVSARTDASLTVNSSSITNNRAVITLSMAPSGFNINTAGANYRMIWAKGTWDSTNNLPTEHYSYNRGATTLAISAAGGTIIDQTTTNNNGGGSSSGNNNGSNAAGVLLGGSVLILTILTLLIAAV